MDTPARVRHLIGSTAEWAAADIVCGEGELVLEQVGGGLVRAKVGRTGAAFSALAYLDTGPPPADAPKVYTKNQSVLPVVLTSASSVAIDAALSNNFELTLAHHATLAGPTHLSAGMVLNILIRQPASGGPFTCAFASVFDFGAVVPVMSVGASQRDFVSAYCALDGTLVAAFRKGS